MSDSLFEKPSGDWSDDEIRVGLVQIAQRTEVTFGTTAPLVR